MFEIISFVIILIILLYLSGWFSSSESALTDISSSQIATLRKGKQKNVQYLIYLKQNMDRTLITILFGNNVVNIALSSIAAILAESLFHAIGVSIMIGIITFLIVIFGEISPKSKAIIHPQKVALKRARIIFWIMKLLHPIIMFLLIISKQFLSKKDRKKQNLLISDDSIKDLATLGEHQGIIKKIEKELIHQVFNFGDRKISDILIPIQKVFTVNFGDDLLEIQKKISQQGFTRVPVLKKQKVVGVIYSKDLILRQTLTLNSLMRKPFFVNFENDISDIFLQMKKKRVHLAIVRDKTKNHIGIVTMEDILEELVGNIYDEFYDQKFGK